MVARFWRDGDTLYTQLTGQQALEIRPSGPDRFDLLSVAASIVFDAGDPAPGLTLFQSGQQIHASRVQAEEEKEEAWKPTADELKAFTGRFYSDEIETFYTVSLEKPEADAEGEAHLVLEQLRLGKFTLQPGERDTFRAPNGIAVQFERDRLGEVIGLYADATRTRDVRFERVR